MNRTARYQALCISLAALALCLGAYAFILKRQETLWQDGILMSSRTLGAMVAAADFKKGIHRIYVLNRHYPQQKYLNRNDGPFEVWAAELLPELGRPGQVYSKAYVEGYNDMMRIDFKRQEEKK